MFAVRYKLNFQTFIIEVEKKNILCGDHELPSVS